MRKCVCQAFITNAPVLSSDPPLSTALRCICTLMCKLIVYSVPLALVACASSGWIEIPTYQHYYFYAPRVAAVPVPGMDIGPDGATIDLAFKGSKNTLSATTMPSRGNEGFAVVSALVSSDQETDYTGVLAFDAIRQGASIPMRLWVAASCSEEDWAISPSKVRLVDPTGSSSQIPLSVYLKATPAVLHPDSQVQTAHWQYTPLDPTQEIRCQRGETIAFTVGFDMTLKLTSLRLIFADSLQSNGMALHIPDVDLSLIGGQIYKSTKRISVIEVLVKGFGSMAR